MNEAIEVHLPSLNEIQVPLPYMSEPVNETTTIETF